MRVDEAGQDELARRVDDRVVRVLQPGPTIGGQSWRGLGRRAWSRGNPYGGWGGYGGGQGPYGGWRNYGGGWGNS
jgi:hypothetical protein